MSTLRSVMRNGSAALILAGLLGMGTLASAATDKKPAPAPRPAPAAHQAPRPSGGGASHGPTTGGASHGPTTGGASHGPTTGGASHGPTTGGSMQTHGPTTGGATNMNTGGGGTTTHGPTTGGSMQTHGPTTGGATHATDGGITHGAATGGAATHGPTTGGATHATDGGITHGAATGGAAAHGPTTGGATHATDGGITHGATSAGAHPGPVGAHPGPVGAHPTPIRSGPAPKGSHERVTTNGGAIRTRPNGKVSDVHDPKRGMDIHHGLNGGHRVSVERPDHSRVFSERGRPGYVQRGYSYHGHDFARRSYFYHGHEYNRFYRGYGFHGVFLNVYAPGFYFHPAFYGWAYTPWVAPISFGWGWGGSPWYGRYGYYFQPYPVYPSAAFWLTDYIISQNLQAAYAAQQAAAETAPTPDAAANGQPVLTPDVKQLIADEVRNQLALENQEAQQNAQQQDVDPASSGIARLLSDGRPHVFVAGGSLDVTDASGQECVVSDGDTLQLRDAPPSDATTANLVVLSSKGAPECQISLTVQVQLTDLQEMQNHMRETIDQGLQELQAKQGTGGLPAAPPAAQGQPAPAAYAAAAPPPDANVAAQVQQVDQQSSQAETDVNTQATQDSGAAAPAATPTVDLGQTTDQVQAILGAPVRVANLGPKVIYYYNDMKVVFTDGKVTDVQ